MADLSILSATRTRAARLRLASKATGMTLLKRLDDVDGKLRPLTVRLAGGHFAPLPARGSAAGRGHAIHEPRARAGRRSPPADLRANDQAIATVAQRALEHTGYRVTARTSSGDALALFRADPDQFDLVLTDHTMPGMTGTQLAQELRRIRPDVPMILITGLGEAITLERGRDLGFCECLMKPVSVHELAAAVRRVPDQVKAER